MLELVLFVPCVTLAVLFALPVLVQLAGSLRRHRRSAPESGAVPRLLFLVPAHDERALVGGCVRSLLNQRYPAAARRVVVIADNCTDETAAIARAAGAEVLERTDPVLRGKPRALQWALAQLPVADYDACVIVDADSVVEPEFARGLARHAPLRDRAVQAYFGTLNETENWLTRLAGVLARCRYEITYPRKRRAGLNCPLTGNGMCLGTSLLRDGWTAFSLTENWELYAQLTAQGVEIAYAHEARLLSQEVRSLQQGDTQRQRWLAGRTGVLRQWFGRLWLSRRIGLLQKIDATCELAAPSPVLHLSLALVLASVSDALLPWTLSRWVSGFALMSLLAYALDTLLVIGRHPEPGPTVAAFARLPVYALWRVSLAAKTLLLPATVEWRKTERH